jgi:DNA-binding MarR family transcriptional regulator
MPDAASEPNAVTDEILNDFGNVVAGMARLLTVFSTVRLFKDAEIGLAEWAALSALQEQDGITNQQLARRLGVTRQRAHQLAAGFISAGLITARTSDVDSRKNELSLTPLGRERLNTVNHELKLLLWAALKRRVRHIGKMKRSIALLMRVAQYQAKSASRSVEGVPLDPPFARPDAGRPTARAV